MSRDGSGVYTKPFPDVVGATTIASAVYNGFVNDVAADLNAARPVIAGGTGASNAVTALFNLGAEASTQIVTNFDTQVWTPGSFFAATTASGSPVGGHAFSGQVNISEALANPPTNANVTVEARDATTGLVWVRIKTANVWSAWALMTAATDAAIALKVAKAGDVMTGNLAIAKATPALLLNKPAGGTDAVVQGLTNSLTRWSASFGDPTTEGGANAGSNWSLNAYNDVGSYLSTPLFFSRATGLGVVIGDPASPLGIVTKQYADAITTAYGVAITAAVANRVRFDAAQGLTTGQAAQARANIAAALRGHLWGLTLSTAGSVNIFGIAAGECADSTNLDLMVLASAYTKTTGSWAVGSGNGALDTGSVSNTWYHVFAIKRPDTGVVDVLLSLSATAPTLPTNYTLFRRIGSLKLESSLWRKFIQNGDEFEWDTPINDANNTTTPTSPAALTLSTPTGIILNASIFVEFSSTPAAQLLIYDPAKSAQTQNTPPGNVSVLSAQAGVFESAPLRVFTNASAQVQHVASQAGSLFIATRGWTDTRGRLS